MSLMVHGVTLLWTTLLLGGMTECQQVIHRPKSCNHTESWFRHRKAYVYHYESVLRTGFVGTSDATVGYKLVCDVTVRVPKRCEVTFQFTDCMMNDSGLDGQLKTSEQAERFARELEQHELYVQMDKGQAPEQKLVVAEQEPEYVTNVKRAVVSQLLLPILPDRQYDHPVIQEDIFGACPMTVTFDPQSRTVVTQRDLTLCHSLPHLYGRVISPFSLARQSQLRLLRKPIDELVYPFASDVQCQQRVGSLGIRNSTCWHYQAFQPITFHGKLVSTPTFNITQSLSLVNVTKMSRRQAAVHRSMEGRKVTHLRMHLELPPTREVTSHDVYKVIDETTRAYSLQAEQQPEQFRELVAVLKASEQEALDKVVTVLMTCRGASPCPLQNLSQQLDAKLVQSLRESFFTDGLLSCGTEECMATYIKCLQTGLVSFLEGEIILINLGLFYHPHPAAISELLALCKVRQSFGCWLSLGSLVGRLAQHVKSDNSSSSADDNLHYLQHGQGQVAAAAFATSAREVVHQVLTHFRAVLGDACKPGVLRLLPEAEQHDKVSSLLVTLKALSNAGDAVQELYDDATPDSRQILPVVIRCLDNRAVPSKVVSAAMAVLRKLKSEKKVLSALTSVLADPARPMTLRTMAFDRLVRHDEATSLRQLLDVIVKERLQGLKMYMLTRLGHLLESNHPHERSLRDLWRTTLAENGTKLPEIEEILGRGSRYGEISRYFVVPLTNSQYGGRLGLRLVMDPASVAPSHFRLTVSFLLRNHSWELLEIAADLQGLENVAKELLGEKGLNLQGGLGALVARILQAGLPKRGDKPPILQLDKKVLENLHKLLSSINMPLGDLPQAEFQVKVFGSEVGYIHLEDLIQLFMPKQHFPSDKEPPKLLIFAQMLTQGFHKFVGKASKLVEIVKVLPTVAGVPWRAEVYGTMVASAMFHAAGDVGRFLRKAGPLELTGEMGTRIVVAVAATGAVQLHNVTTSGVKVNLTVEVNTKVESAVLRYSQVPERPNQPGALFLDLGAGNLKRPLKIVGLRSDLFLTHNGQETRIQTPDTQVPVTRCAPDAVRRWTGHAVCLEGFHQQLGWSAHRPLPVLSGPVQLSLVARPDDRLLKQYNLSFTFTREDDDPSGTVVVFKANASGPGVELNRTFDAVLRVQPSTKEFSVHTTVPEFGLDYSMGYNATSTYAFREHSIVSSMLRIKKQLLHSFILETLKEVVPGETAQLSSSDNLFRFNFSLPRLSLELFANITSGRELGLYTHNFYLRYMCSPQLGLLYALHVRPDLAARSGHVSQWTFSNRAQFSGQALDDDWQALDDMAILLPGHNLTVMNTMVANISLARRNTTILWTSNQGLDSQTTDVIRMNAQVRNESSYQGLSMYYVMQLEQEGKCEVTLQGEIKGHLANLNITTDILYKSKAIRAKRSLQGIYDRLQRAEEVMVASVESAEEMIARRGAELSDSFVKWLSGGSPSDQKILAAAGSVPKSEVAGPVYELEVPDVSPVIHYFAKPMWRLHINFNFKLQPSMSVGQPTPEAMRYLWTLDANMPDVNKDFLYFNGTFERGIGAKKWDGATQWLVKSEILGLQLDYLLRQNIQYPRIYHKSQWQFVNRKKHSMDRSFAFLVDLERQDHLMYSLHFAGPSANLSHSISFNRTSKVSSFQDSLILHTLSRAADIVYGARSELTAKKLEVTVTLNSTWANARLNVDLDYGKRGAIMGKQFLFVATKLWFLNGSREVSATLDMDLANKKRPPSLTIFCRKPDGNVTTVLGQLLNPRQVLFAVSQKAGEKQFKLLDWYIALEEPTLLSHSLQWNRTLTEPLLHALGRFYIASAHSFRLFGQTVADNIHRNVSDMVIPFTNTTVSQAVDQVVQRQMQKVAMAGLDPRTNVPLRVKVLKGGLSLVQALQSTWGSSTVGQVVSMTGLPTLLSQAARHSTSLHYMLVQDPPFPLRQFLKHFFRPALHRLQQTPQFNFSLPLPFVWDYFLAGPRARMWWRMREEQTFASRPFSYLAVLTSDKVQTFDGVTYSYSVPHSKCAYLLTTDLVVGNHSVLLKRSGVELSLTKSKIELTWDGGVVINNTKTIVRDLPVDLAMDETTVELKEGLVNVFVGDLLRWTFDPVTQTQVFEVPAHAHNRSIGLLGTNTLEAGDDFRLPSGNITYDALLLLKEYELSGQRQCQTATPGPQLTKCSPKLALCDAIFVNKSSHVAACFPYVSPNTFRDACLKQVCEEKGADSTSACMFMMTYQKVCASRVLPDHAVHLHDLPRCDCHAATKSKKNSMKLDLVLVSALGGRGNLQSMVSSLATHVEGDPRFGLVLDHDRPAHVHIFDQGQLFTVARHLKAFKTSELSGNNKTGQPNALLQMAAQFPFRRGARRLVILFADENTLVPLGMQNLLWDKDLSLVVVSPELERHKVSYITWDKQIDCQKCNKNKIEMPNSVLGQLVTGSHGAWVAPSSVHGKKFNKALKQLALQQGPQCLSLAASSATTTTSTKAVKPR